jgi:hypothetical protein
LRNEVNSRNKIIKTRKTLGVNKNEMLITMVGVPEGDYISLRGDSDLNTEFVQQTLESIFRMAKMCPNVKIKLLLLAHPRALFGTNLTNLILENKFRYLKRAYPNVNIKLINSTRDDLGDLKPDEIKIPHDIVEASDILLSIGSTELIKSAILVALKSIKKQLNNFTVPFWFLPAGISNYENFSIPPEVDRKMWTYIVNDPNDTKTAMDRLILNLFRNWNPIKFKESRWSSKLLKDIVPKAINIATDNKVLNPDGSINSLTSAQMIVSEIAKYLFA